MGKYLYDKDLSVVVPVFNEEGNLPELYRRLTAVLSALTEKYEIIFVNDGSSDSSLRLIEDFAAADSRVYYIALSRNFGHQVAVSAGLDYARGRATVIMDADLQDPPELIPELYGKHTEGYQVVYVRRRKREGESAFKKISAKLFYRLMRRVARIDMPMDTGDFRLIDHHIVSCLRRMPEQSKFLRGQIAWMGYRQTGIELDRPERKHGRSGYSVSKMFALAFDGITGFSNKPLEWVSRMGLIVFLIALAVIIYSLIRHYVYHQTVEGWTSIIASSMFIGGIQLLSIGVIGSYIARINKNTDDRPLYLIADSNIETDSEE